MPPPPCGGPLTHRAFTDFSSISTTADNGLDGDDSDGGDWEKDHDVHLNNHTAGGDNLTVDERIINVHADGGGDDDGSNGGDGGNDDDDDSGGNKSCH